MLRLLAMAIILFSFGQHAAPLLAAHGPQQTNAYYYFQRGQSYQNQGMFYQALHEYGWGINDWSDRYYASKCLYFSGFCNVKLGRYYDARNNYEKYIWDYPTGDLIDAAHYVNGRVLEELHDIWGARRMYETVIQRWPYGQYAPKARERLAYLNGNNGGYPPYQGPFTPSPFMAVEEQAIESIAKAVEPFTEGAPVKLDEAVNSLDDKKTSNEFRGQLRYHLLFQRIHGDTSVEPLLEKFRK